MHLLQAKWLPSLLILLIVPSSTPTNSGQVKEKRAPLEIGLVSLQHIPASTQKNTYKSNENIRHIIPASHKEWVPGHVVNHHFIPAHTHTVYEHFPVHSVSKTGPIEVIEHHQGVVVTHPLKIFKSNPLQYHNYEYYGGYGEGISSGGHGSGHGYWGTFPYRT